MPYPKQIQDRIAPYVNDSAGAINDELALARALLAEAVLAGRNHDAVGLLQLIGRLSETQISNDIKIGKLLPAPMLIETARKLCEAITHRLAHLPNYDVLSDEIVGNFQRIFAEQRLLTCEKPADTKASEIEEPRQ